MAGCCLPKPSRDTQRAGYRYFIRFVDHEGAVGAWLFSFPQPKPDTNEALQQLFSADQQARENHPEAGTPEYVALRSRGHTRRQQVQQLMDQHQVATAQDYDHAALLFQHGEAVEEIGSAHWWALKSVELGLPAGRWLAAAALDQWHMYQGQPQKYGTQQVPDGTRYRLWDLDARTSDRERAAWDVLCLAELQRRAQQLTVESQGKLPPLDGAPAWLQQALLRWKNNGGTMPLFTFGPWLLQKSNLTR